MFTQNPKEKANDIPDLISGEEREEQLQFQQDFTYDEVLEICGLGCYQYQLFFLTGAVWAADAMEIMLLSFLQPMLQEEWDLDGSQSGSIGAVIFVGMLFGTWFWAYLSDTYGRRPALLASLLMCAVFGSLTATSTNLTMLLFFRGLVGFGAGGASASYTLFAEFAPTDHRGNALLLEQGFWSAGAIFCVAVAWVFIPCCGWRWFVLICSFPLWMVLCFYWAVPESPRWLITVGRMKEAEAICRNIARINGKDLPSGNLVGKSSTNQERGTSMKDLWLPAYKLTTNLLFISFFCCVLTYYGISFLSEHVFEGKNVYWEMMITTSSEIPGLLIGFCVLDRIGRRNTLTLFYTLFTVCTFLLIFDSIAKNQSAAILLIFIGRLCIASAFYTLYIYFSEFYPTVIRNRALGSASAIGRIAGITTNFIVTNMSISSACSIYFTFGFIGIIVSYTLPIETLGRKMGDSLQINEIEDIHSLLRGYEQW